MKQTQVQILSNIDAEAKTRGDADTSLGNRIKAIEDLNTGGRITTLETDNTANKTAITGFN